MSSGRSPASALAPAKYASSHVRVRDDGRRVAVGDLVRREPAPETRVEARETFLRARELERAQPLAGIERDHVADRGRENSAREDHGLS